MSSSPARSFKHLASAQLARLARRPRLTPAQLLALRPANILIVRQHNQMGDMVCATPALRAIRETWPSAHITLVTAPVNRGVVEHNPHLDRLVTFDRRVWQHPLRLAGFLREIRRGHPELAFVLSSVSFSVTSALGILPSSLQRRSSSSTKSGLTPIADPIFRSGKPCGQERFNSNASTPTSWHFSTISHQASLRYSSMIDAINIRSGYLSLSDLNSSIQMSKLRSLISSIFSQPKISLDSRLRSRA